jgi:hypothetical protein
MIYMLSNTPFNLTRKATRLLVHPPHSFLHKALLRFAVK